MVDIIQMLGPDLPQAQVPQKRQHPLEALAIVDQRQVLQAGALLQPQHILRILGKGLPPV